VAIRQPKIPDGGLYIGLNSGTSADRIDACLVRAPSSRAGGERPLRIRLLARASAAIPAPLRDLIYAGPDRMSARDLCVLDARIGERFGVAAARVLSISGVEPSDVRAIGLHGQTVCHLPAAKGGSCSLQIGSPERVAAIAGIDVVSDFRQADIAAGGEGAPLSPVLDHALFRGGGGALVLNIGGIANLTAVPASGDRERVVGLDVGPGNMLLDGLARRWSRGRLGRDEGGGMALRGRVDPTLLARALAYRPLLSRTTRSLGREEFGEPFLDHFLAGALRPPRAIENLLATAAAVTAECAWRAVASTVLPRGGSWGRSLWVCGGGLRNGAILRELRARFEPRSFAVRPFERGGVSARDRECVLFAFLAREFLARRPGNIPSVTGATRPVVLGSLSPRPVVLGSLSPRPVVLGNLSSRPEPAGGHRPPRARKAG